MNSAKIKSDTVQAIRYSISIGGQEQFHWAFVKKLPDGTFSISALIGRKHIGNEKPPVYFWGRYSSFEDCFEQLEKHFDGRIECKYSKTLMKTETSYDES